MDFDTIGGVGRREAHKDLLGMIGEESKANGGPFASARIPIVPELYCFPSDCFGGNCNVNKK